jgi:hypothetical protein
MVSIVGNPDWRSSSEHLVNTRGPLVYIYIHNGTVVFTGVHKGPPYECN